MIRRLLALIFHVDCSGPWTVPARGGGPALDRALDDPIRITQDRPGHARSIGQYFTDGNVPY